jgi:hypothetical protein
LKLNKLDHYIERFGINCDFDVRSVQVSVAPEFITKHDEHKMFASRYYTNAALDLMMLVVKR